MQIEENKPIVIFTTFWDAQYILEKGFIEERNEESNTSTYIDLQDSEVYSVALSCPKDVKLEGIIKIKFFCPPWSLLKKYKNDTDWEHYVIEYTKLLVQNKQYIKNWINSLDPTKVYILCCWENTSKGAHCHRRLIYDAFIKSQWAKNKMNLIYRHGNG